MSIVILADSTAAHKERDRRPETGWGECLGNYIGNLPILNFSVNGLSTKSCIDSGVLDQALAATATGDIALIEFGHNDADVYRSDRHTDPLGEFPHNLGLFVRAFKTAGATPVLMTPICRNHWRNGLTLPANVAYADAVRIAAEALDVPLIDMTVLSAHAMDDLGEQRAREWFMTFGPGLYANMPDGNIDDTHLRPQGADALAHIVAQQLQRLGLV